MSSRMVFPTPILSCGMVFALAMLAGTSGEPFPPRLILISMDSLSYPFIQALSARNRTHFDYLKNNGVFAERILNVFPTATYPNHYTMITGLYPESHGLVANRFYDPNLDKHFSLSVPEDNYASEWYNVGAEPIYVTNGKAGGKRKSGTVLFPTGMAMVKGIAPDYWVPDDGTYKNTWQTSGFPYIEMPYTDRVDRMISWFTNKANPINLGLLYFNEPDELAHAHGWDSDEVKGEMGGPLNDALGYLINKLREHDLLESTNIILTADHGHTNRKKIVVLEDYVNSEWYTTWDETGKSSIAVGLNPLPGRIDDVVEGLKKCPDVFVYRKDGRDLAAMNYTKSDRIAPVIVTGKEGVVIRPTQEAKDKYTTIGLHGFDPVKYPSMRPVFLAAGPGFKKGLVSHELNMVDVYPLMCQLLGLDPAPNNGSIDNVRHLLATDVNGASGIVGSTHLLMDLIIAMFVSIHF